MAEVYLSTSSFVQGEQVASPAWEPSKANCVLALLCENVTGWVSSKASETFAIDFKRSRGRAENNYFLSTFIYFTLGLVPGVFRSGLALEVLQSEGSISVNVSLLFQI